MDLLESRVGASFSSWVGGKVLEGRRPKIEMPPNAERGLEDGADVRSVARVNAESNEIVAPKCACQSR